MPLTKGGNMIHDIHIHPTQNPSNPSTKQKKLLIDWFRSIHSKLWMDLIHPPYFQNPMDHLFKKKNPMDNFK
jgi:hypothetical protein